MAGAFAGKRAEDIARLNITNESFANVVPDGFAMFFKVSYFLRQIIEQNL